MKRKIIALVILGLSLTSFSCVLSRKEKPEIFEVQSLVGTTWHTTDSAFHFPESLEFLDNMNCFYTFLDNRLPFTYRIRDNIITLSNNTIFVLEENIIMRYRRPFFIME